LHLFGVDSIKITFEEAAEILRGLTPGIEDGTFQPPATRTVSFSGIVEAYRLVGEGKIKGKLILVP
jgi:NADPH:quinone reductase-like Zn-dependent oxidoreductase